MPEKPNTSEILLDVKGLQKWFAIKKGFFSKTVGHVKAVDDVSFQIKKSETLGLVGESGCGKTTTGRAILRLIEPTGGQITYNGENILSFDKQHMRQMRKELQIIFQDPYSSLNPRLTVGQMLSEVLSVHGIARGEKAEARIKELLEIVGLQKSFTNRYPHEFSGGQRQRLGIARALAVDPAFIVCDEPVSALDVSIQSQIINLLQDLQDEFGITYLFIAHDLSVVEHISDRVAVMYLGKIVEIASAIDLYKDPKHPYTKALLSAVPVPDPNFKANRIVLTGDVPSPVNVPSGCYFHPRCPEAKPECKSITPVLAPLDDNPAHEVSCILYPGSMPKTVSLHEETA